MSYLEVMRVTCHSPCPSEPTGITSIVGEYIKHNYQNEVSWMLALPLPSQLAPEKNPQISKYPKLSFAQF
jgi:hypothetical protein